MLQRNANDASYILAQKLASNSLKMIGRKTCGKKMSAINGFHQTHLTDHGYNL